MNRKICLLFLMCLVVVLVKSESTIEVDENGDVYDVKRFNLQGRQLNSGRSQCVVTRRKRAAPPMPMYSNDGLNDEVDDNDEGNTVIDKEQQDILHYFPPSVTPTTGDAEEEEEESNMNEGNVNKKEDEEISNNAEAINNNNSDDNKEIEEENEDYNEEDNNESIEIIQFPYVPVSGQKQSDGESIAAIGLTSAVGQVESHHANAGSNGIVVVQSHTPPKVDPQTHAVFELVPVNHVGAHEDEENEDEDFGDDFDFKEELSPTTTTAFWSTGDDDSNDNSTEKPQKIVQKIRKPVKAQKKKKRNSLQTKRRNKYRDSFQHRPAIINRNRPNKNKNKVRPYKPNVNRPINRRKLRPGHNKRPRPSPQKNKNSNRNKTKYEDDDRNVNCIIIRHDPPPTTARPFRNILGRSANGAPQASGHFGKRKRVNVRFVA